MVLSARSASAWRLACTMDGRFMRQLREGDRRRREGIEDVEDIRKQSESRYRSVTVAEKPFVVLGP